MKKIFFLATALAGLFFAASCQQENLEPVVKGNTVTYTVQVADAVATKALGDDITAVNELVYEVYRTEAEETTTFTDVDNLLYHKTAKITNGTATIELEFVNDQNFTVLFWAQTKDNGVYNVEKLTNVTITSPDAANNVNAQAFVGRDFVRDCVSDANGKVILVRAVSQLNIATTPESLVFEPADGERGSTVVLEGSSVKVSGLATSYDVANLAAFGETATEYEYTETAVPTDVLNVNGVNYTYVAMNYVGFAPADGTSDVTVSYVINTSEGNIDNDILNVPVKPNYRTSIVGNLITSKTDYQITLHKDWYTPEEVVEYWNGSEMNAPQPSATDANVYEIEFPSELAWLAAAVNGTLPAETKAAVKADSYAGKTFVLMNDVDLNGFEWTPIGTSNNIFKGAFDGQGHTVKNLVITGNNSNVGLFGVTHDGEIKNLTVENAKVSGRLNVGVVAGQPYTSKYTNITVKGHVEVNGMAYVGAVGGKNAYADWTNITVNVDETSYVKANSVENGTAYRTYVGGVVGFNGEGGHSFTNITSNINVEGSTCDVGGLFGIAHYGNQFVNCSCSGNVTITTDEAENALEMGGIAGVWNNGGEDVVFTNCTFTGELSTPNLTEEVDFYYGGLVGNPYSATGNGKLIIDGVQYVATAAELQAALAAATGETVIKLGTNIVGDVTVVQKQGVKITIEGLENTYNGSIKVHSNSNYYADAALTIKNVNFETSAASINVIEALENGSQRYSNNITVENCTFTATGAAVNTSVAVQVKATRGVTVTGCTATDMHSLIQAQSCDTGDVKVVNCAVNGKNGVAFKQVKSATVEGTTITALAYGIRFDGNTDNYGIVVKDNNVTANQPLIVRKMTGKNNTIALEGANTLTTEADYQIVVTNDSDDKPYVKPTGTYTLTGADAYTMFPAPAMVATYEQFVAALEAGEDHIKLTADITASAILTIKNPMTLNGNGYTLTSSAGRAINIDTEGEVLVKNLTVVGQGSCQRGFNIINKPADVTLDNVNVSGTEKMWYAVYAWGATNNTLNIKNSEITGWAALAIYNPGITVNVENSHLKGINTQEFKGTHNNQYSVIALASNTPNVNINVTGGSITAQSNEGCEYEFIVGSNAGCSNSVITLDTECRFVGQLVGYVNIDPKETTLKVRSEYAEAIKSEGWVVSEPVNGLVTVSTPAAKVGATVYATFEAAAAAAKAGDTIELVDDVTLSAELTLPANVTLNGNGKQINGTIYAGGNLTFVGHTKVTSFSASYYDRVITIGEGACLEVTGGGRVSLAYGNTFNITGNVADAKTADKANIQPSLIIPAGISITGGSDATMNVTNAYVKIGDTSSKNSAANGTFTLNFNNSIAEFSKQLTFAEPTSGKNPTFNLNVTNSVLTTGTKLIAAAPNSNVKLDNSIVTIATYFRNSGKFEVVNGSVLTGSTIQFGENGGNDGELIVDASVVTINASSTGHALDGKGNGSITLTNGAEAKVTYYKGITVNADATSTFTGTEVK